jgi:hypothetical protein
MITLKISRFIDVVFTKEFEKAIQTTELIIGNPNQEINLRYTRTKSLHHFNTVPFKNKKSAAV